MFFKSKIKADQFASQLIVMLGSVFGESSLANTAKLCDLSFRDEKSYSDALWEWLAFGLYAISAGVRANCKAGSAAVVISSLHEQFYLGLAKAGGSNDDLLRVEKKIQGSLSEYDSV